MDVDASLVIPLQGGPEQALRCFSALAELPDHPRHEVIVVDDASVGLEDLLGQLEGDVQIVRSAGRVGFAAACELGAARASGRVVVLLRGAPAPLGGWLAPLVEALADPVAGLAASQTAGGPPTHPVAAHAVAVRAADLRSAGGVPEAPEGLEIAALCTAVAGSGRRVETVAASVVQAPGSRMAAARRTPGEEIELTVVIPTLDAASERLRRCVAAVQATTECAHEIVVVDNGAPPQGFTAPVNAGLRAGHGRFMLVLNDDVELLPGWWPPLRDELERGASVVFPVTIDGAMRRDFAAWCFAFGRDGLIEFGHGPGEFFDPAFRVWYQDTDLLQRLRRDGRPPVCVDASRIRHGLSETVASEDPELRAWIEREVAADKSRFEAKWSAGGSASGAAPGVVTSPAAGG